MSFVDSPCCILILLNINALPSTFQKVAFQAIKDRLLQAKRPPFIVRKTAFRKTPGQLMIIGWAESD